MVTVCSPTNQTLGKLLVEPVGVCEGYEMTPTESSREELEEIIASLRDENTRLKEEIRRIRRETNEAPPHYL
jgi:hypothetical protein